MLVVSERRSFAAIVVSDATSYRRLMTPSRAHRRNAFGLLLLSAFVQCAAGCGDDGAQPASVGDEPREEAPEGGGGGNVDAPATISVHGRVLDPSKTPLAGLPVLIEGHPLALTDASGEFSVPNVSAPYTATVIVSSIKAVVMYEGLSRPDPTIVAPAYSSSPREAGIQGTLTGGAGYPEAPLTRTSVQLAAAPIQSPTPGLSELGANTFILPPPCNTWTGPATIKGTLHALQFTHKAPNHYKPVQYKGYGTLANVSVTDGENEIPQPITLAPIGTVSFSASATAPAGYEVTEKRVQLTVGGRVVADLPKDTEPGLDITYPVPEIDGAKVQLTVSAEDASTGGVSTATKPGLALGSANATIGILRAPTLVLPVDTATGVNGNSSFSWTKVDNGVHVLMVAGAEPGAPQYLIVTSRTEARLPDLVSAGIQLPPAATYHWAVTGYAPFASVDAYAGDRVAVENDTAVRYEARSAIRSFTTTP